jgi:hypothetical protein
MLSEFSVHSAVHSTQLSVLFYHRVGEFLGMPPPWDPADCACYVEHAKGGLPYAYKCPLSKVEMETQ